MTERVLTTRELNRALLARQLLLDRSPVPLTKAVDRLGGLQTQYARSPYIALWSRLRDFRRDTLTKALEQRRIIQGTVMRVTIHMVSSGDYWPMTVAVRTARREWWRRAVRAGADGLDMGAVAARTREHLLNGPLRALRLKELLHADGFPPAAWSGVGLWLDLVRVPPSGTWDQRRADLYGLAEHWVEPSRATEAEGIELLVRRYLGGFGPAPAKDIASWAGLPVSAVLPALERLGLRRYRDEEGAVLFDVPRAPLPDAATRVPVRFLPTWDPTLLAHARRTQILPEDLRPQVFNIKTPHSNPTFLIDGAVAGTWRWEKGRVQLEPFDGIPRAAKHELKDEAQRLAAFHAD